MLKQKKSFRVEEIETKTGRIWRVLPTAGNTGPRIDFGFEAQPAEEGASNVTRSHVIVKLDVVNEAPGQTSVIHVVENMGVGEARTMAVAENLGKRGIRRYVRPIVEKIIDDHYKATKGA